MKIRVFIVGLSFMSLLFVTCQDNRQETVSSNIQDLNEENFISENQILDRLSNKVSTYANEVEGLIDLQNKEVEDISSVSGEGDKLASFYIVNFKDSGFVVMSADERMPDILSFSENERFNYDANKKIDKVSDGDMPYGVKIWLKNAVEAVSLLRTKNENIFYQDSVEYAKTYAQAQIPQATRLIKTTWGQRNGYNDFMNVCLEGTKYPLGCTTVAVGQLMKYWTYPNVYNWSDMPNTYANATSAQFLRDVADKTIIAKSCKSSSANTESVQLALRYFGYTSTSQYLDHYVLNNIVIKELENKRPCLFQGATTEGTGHMWLCDGVHSSFLLGLILRMDWGWYGDYNGWYFAFTNNPGSYNFSESPYVIHTIYQKYTYPYIVN